MAFDRLLRQLEGGADLRIRGTDHHQGDDLEFAIRGAPRGDPGLLQRRRGEDRATGRDRSDGGEDLRYIGGLAEVAGRPALQRRADERRLLEAKVVEVGDLIVLTIGEPIGKAGGTNSIKIVDELLVGPSGTDDDEA